MAEVKAGDLNLNSSQNWEANYWTLISSNNADEIMEIVRNADTDNGEWEYYVDNAYKILFSTTETESGFLRKYVGAGVTTGAAGAAGGLAASALGATTVTTSAGGLLGLLGATTTAVVAAPLALVAGAAVGAAALGYGAYKLATNSAENEGKDKQHKKTLQEGRYEVNPVRTLNPFVFFFAHTAEYLRGSYDMLHALPTRSEADDIEFLRLFSAEILDREQVYDFSGLYYDIDSLFDELKQHRIDNFKSSVVSYARNYHDSLKARYMNENQDMISKVAALMDINNEYITARMDRSKNMEEIVDIQKGNFAVHIGYMLFQGERAIFAMLRLLLNHPQNTPDKRDKQLDIAYKQAAALSLETAFEKILNEKRNIKLNVRNYLDYLNEIMEVHDKDTARQFIFAACDKLAECMLVDSKIEPYEKEILQNIVNEFSDFIGEIKQDSHLYKALNQ